MPRELLELRAIVSSSNLPFNGRRLLRECRVGKNRQAQAVAERISRRVAPALSGLRAVLDRPIPRFDVILRAESFTFIRSNDVGVLSMIGNRSCSIRRAARPSF